MTIMRMMVMITMVRMMSLVMVMVVQGTDWQRSGGLLASHCKDKMVRVFDPRTGGGPTQVQTNLNQFAKDFSLKKNVISNAR